MKKILYVALCALGGGMIGFFSNRITEIDGCIFFTIGVILMVYSIIKASK